MTRPVTTMTNLTPILPDDQLAPAGHAARRAGVGFTTARLSTWAGDAQILRDVSLTIEPGELVAVIGASGAGKTTLLELLATVRLARRGQVSLDGLDPADHARVLRSRVGFVPQDDIVHSELPLGRTLRYAAALRLPPGSDADAAVDTTLARLDLADRRDVAVGALSGGQRKRASIAVELLAGPDALLLDEPTSGLDPATASSVVGLLRTVSDRGSTVVFTTHSVQDVYGCDRLIILGAGGRLVYDGPVAGAAAAFEVDDLVDVYAMVAHEAAAAAWAAHHRLALDRDDAAPAAGDGSQLVVPLSRARLLTQVRTLAARGAEITVRSRLTLAILLGSPALVIAMFVVLFRRGAFDAQPPQPSALVMIVFWVAFGGFFFGLTSGLLQICTERAIMRREQLSGVSPTAYVASKVVVLTPFLVVVVAATLGVLRLLDRLPAVDGSTWAVLLVTLALDAVAALALGLATSAAVTTPAQAALALPMLCFPAVLFSGAILPVAVMAPLGRWISALMPDRWTFEAVADRLGLPDRLDATWHATDALPLAHTWLILLAFIGVLLVVTRQLVVRGGRR